MSFTQRKIYYQGKTIHRQAETGLICLTDLWNFQGSVEAKSPLNWVRLETTQTLLSSLVDPNETVVVWAEDSAKEPSNTNQQLIAEIPGILETTKQGQELWTYATEELVVVYARFLSAECYQWSLEYLVEGDREEADYLEIVEARAKAKRQKQFSRRALIAAGWAIPVVLSVGFNQRAVAAGSGNRALSDSQNWSSENYRDRTDFHRDSHNDFHNDRSDGVIGIHTDGLAGHGDGHGDSFVANHLDSDFGGSGHLDFGDGHADVHVDN